MIKLIAKIDPFIYTQSVYVYSDDRMISMHSVDTPNLARDLVQLSYSYKAEEVNLNGSRLYLTRFVKEMKKEELKNYEHNKLKINIIQGE